MAGRRAKREALKLELKNRGVSASKLQGKSVRELEAMLRSGPAKLGKAKPPRKKPVSRKKPEAARKPASQKSAPKRPAPKPAPRAKLSNIEASGGGYSEQGPRDYQEDRWFAKGNLAIVADGMGGHASGDEAAQITVDTIAGFLPRSPNPKLLADAVHEANKRVYQALHQVKAGCTLVAGLVSGNDLYVAHVGDARCTAVYKGRLERITKDHSIVQQMVDAGRISEEEARVHPRGNIVTRSIGKDPFVEVDTKRVPLKAGMTFVFSSDGVHDYLTNDEFIRICEGSHDPKSVARRLVQKALANGSNDNCTATVLKIHPATSMYEEVGGYGMEMNPRRNGRKKGGGRTQLALETPRDLREQISWRTVAEGSRPDLEEEIEWRGPTKEPFLSLWDDGWRKYKARHDWAEGPMIIHFWMGPDGSRDFLKIKDSPLERGAVPLKNNPKLRKFRVSSRPIMPWGGGHTAATDPTRNGWSIKKVGRAYLIAKKGDVVAASARKVGDKWDVALYWNKPSDVRRYLRTGHQFDSEGYTIEPTYETVPDTPGWGLTVIDLLDRERRVLKEMD